MIILSYHKKWFHKINSLLNSAQNIYSQNSRKTNSTQNICVKRKVALLPISRKSCHGGTLLTSVSDSRNQNAYKSLDLSPDSIKIIFKFFYDVFRRVLRKNTKTAQPK